VRRASIAGRRVTVVGHVLDARFGSGRLASHVGIEHPSVTAGSVEELRLAVPDGADIVAIDEAQFFGPELASLATDLAARGLTVIVAGLSVTFDGAPFEPLPTLMALAERVDKLTAVCTVCGAEAVYHVRITASDAPAAQTIAEHVGSTDKYQARCRDHFRPRLIARSSG
jgi:thymidine kinase